MIDAEIVVLRAPDAIDTRLELNFPSLISSRIDQNAVAHVGLVKPRPAELSELYLRMMMPMSQRSNQPNLCFLEM